MIDRARYQTVKTYRYTANTAGVTIDLTAAGELGPADAVLINVDGADRTVQVRGTQGQAVDLFTVKDGRTPVFEVRSEEIVVSSGTSSTIEVWACYIDRWTT